MRKTNKKGFTIVELVIVIAVIAILAGVLIPVFSGIVKKANLSNDKSFVRNANMTLMAEVIPEEKFATAGDAIDALNANGFAGKFNAYTSGHHYAYSLENNKLYLVDENSAVIYPEENVAVDSLWGLYMDQRTSKIDGVTKYVAMQNITNSTHFAEVFASGNYTIDLNGYFIKVDGTYDNVTADNGLVIGGVEQGENASSDYALVKYIEGSNWIDSSNGVMDSATNTLTITKKVFTKQSEIITTDINYIFDDCIFYGSLVLNDVNGATANAIVKNSKFYIDDSWSILSHRSLEVDNCEFNGATTRGHVQIQENSNNMTVKVTNSIFNGTESVEYPTIRFVVKDSRGKNYATAGLDSFELSNCTFNSNRAIIGFSGEATLYNYAGTGATVTISNISIADSISNYVMKAGVDCILSNLLSAAKA